jgi:hypothetical protein
MSCCQRALLCWRTTRAIVRSQAWPINNAQNELQVLCGRRSLPTLHFFDDPGAAKGVAGVDCLGGVGVLEATKFAFGPSEENARDGH